MGRHKVLITVLENIGFMEPSEIPVSQCATVVPDIDSGRGCACWGLGGWFMGALYFMLSFALTLKLL